MGSKINRIKEISGVLNSTARPTKYRLSFAWPIGVAGVSNLYEVDVLCKSAQAPQRTLGVIETWTQGRKMVQPGDTAYDNSWDSTFYLDESHTLRIDMVKWQESCDDFHRNLHAGLPGSIFTDLKLEQLDSAGNVSARYTMHNCFPLTIGEVSYDDSSVDTPLEFTMTFSYTDWVLGSGDTNDVTPMKPTLNPTSYDA